MKFQKHNKPIGILIFACILMSVILLTPSFVFSESIGTEGNPFVITTAEELNNTRNNLDAFFILGADIDLSGYGDNEGWLPIGGDVSPFVGSFDGNGYTISNLTINRPNSNYVGLFGHINGNATVKNIIISNCTITGYDKVGSLTGQAHGESQISNCFGSGTIYGHSKIGGLFGYAGDCYVDNCSFVGDVGNNIQTASRAGGVFGQCNSVTISKCSFTGTIKSTGGYNGGLIGQSNSNTVDSCWVKITAETTYATGGFMGYCDDTTISNSYILGSINNTNKAGGLIGHAYSPISTATNCYIAIELNTIGISGSLSGNGCTVNSQSTYYNSDIIGSITYDQGISKNTTEMMDVGTFLNWDFDNTWAIIPGEAYPFLRMNPPPVSEILGNLNGYIENNIPKNKVFLSLISVTKQLLDSGNTTVVKVLLNNISLLAENMAGKHLTIEQADVIIDITQVIISNIE